jgi:transcriptional regulator with XRE-family HTH domain
MTSQILLDFGQRIKYLRKSNEYSQEKLAELTGFHRTYIGLVENGKRNVSLKNLEKFSKAFNLHIHELMNF